MRRERLTCEGLSFASSYQVNTFEVEEKIGHVSGKGATISLEDFSPFLTALVDVLAVPLEGRALRCGTPNEALQENPLKTLGQNLRLMSALYYE